MHIWILKTKLPWESKSEEIGDVWDLSGISPSLFGDSLIEGFITKNKSIFFKNRKATSKCLQIIHKLSSQIMINIHISHFFYYSDMLVLNKNL